MTFEELIPKIAVTLAGSDPAMAKVREIVRLIPSDWFTRDWECGDEHCTHGPHTLSYDDLAKRLQADGIIERLYCEGSGGCGGDLAPV
jgi:hypothetical protein